jgi:hypothetical protein
MSVLFISSRLLAHPAEALTVRVGILLCPSLSTFGRQPAHLLTPQRTMLHAGLALIRGRGVAHLVKQDFALYHGPQAVYDANLQ